MGKNNKRLFKIKSECYKFSACGELHTKSLYTNLFMVKKMPPEGRRNFLGIKILYMGKSKIITLLYRDQDFN